MNLERWPRRGDRSGHQPGGVGCWTASGPQQDSRLGWGQLPGEETRPEDAKATVSKGRG